MLLHFVFRFDISVDKAVSFWHSYCSYTLIFVLTYTTLWSDIWSFSLSLRSNRELVYKWQGPTQDGSCGLCTFNAVSCLIFQSSIFWKRKSNSFICLSTLYFRKSCIHTRHFETFLLPVLQCVFLQRLACLFRFSIWTCLV